MFFQTSYNKPAAKRISFYVLCINIKRGISNAAVIELAAPFSAANSIQCF